MLQRNNENHGKIGQKVNRLLLSMVTAAMFLAGAVGTYGQFTVISLSKESGRELGGAAAVDAEMALERMAVEHLTDMAEEKAAYIEAKFADVEADALGIAAQAEKIYDNPSGYPDREVPLPVPASTGMAAQLLWSEQIGPYGVLPSYTLELLKLGNLQDMLVQLNDQNDMISSTYLATESGWMIQADTIAYSKYGEDNTLPLPYEAASRQWYQMALKAKPGETIYTDIIQDIHQGGDCIVCAAPVYHGNQVVAVVGIGSYLDTVNRVVLSTDLMGDGYAFLVNEKGQILVSGREDGETAVHWEQTVDLRESENPELAEAAVCMVSGESGYRRLTVDGKEVYLAYAPLSKLGWSFATVMDVEKVLSPAAESQDNILALARTAEEEQENAVRRIFLLFTVLYVLAVAIIYGVGMGFSRRLTEPIRKLTKDVAQFDGGHLDYRIHIYTGDEVEALGEAFNRMAHQIQKYIQNLAAITAEKERIRTEIQVAARLQADMLPEASGAFAERKEFSLYAHMIPAKGVGGDFYDFFLLDEDHLVMVMADVSGKGVPAALFMVVARTLIRSRLLPKEQETWYEDGCLGQIVSGINDLLCSNNKNGMFVTAWLGILTISTGRLEYVNAGHCSPLIQSEDGTCVCESKRSGFVLAGMEGSEYRSNTIQLRMGDTLLLYTDGVTEATSLQKELYGEERLKQTVEEADGYSPRELIQHVWESVNRFQTGTEQFDDVTMLSIAYHGGNYWEKCGIPDTQNLPEYALFLEKVLKPQGISKNTVISLQTTLDEVYSNIFYHSGANEVTMEIRVSETGERVTLIFEDDGKPYNPLEYPDPDIKKSLPERKEGGLGIYLIKRWMHRVEYEYIGGKNRLTLVAKNLRS